jgi:rubrerythrin
MMMGGGRRHGGQARRLEELTDAEIVALAIGNEGEAVHAYRSFAEVLGADFPDSSPAVPGDGR